jgi:hypothetical protein
MPPDPPLSLIRLREPLFHSPTTLSFASPCPSTLRHLARQYGYGDCPTPRGRSANRGGAAVY